MVLQYMLSDVGSTNRQQANRGTSDCEKKAEQARIKRRALVCFLLLAYIIVANVSYNLWAKDRSTPIWELLTANVISDLWTTKKSTITEPGTVMGILHCKGNSWALIGHELVHEGDVTNGIKVVKIDQQKVEFEKNGERWTQKVLANPDSAWKTAR